MAVTLFMRVPELSLERYDTMMVSLGLDANPPAGLVLHVATEAVGAVNVVEIWQTPRRPRDSSSGAFGPRSRPRR